MNAIHMKAQMKNKHNQLKTNTTDSLKFHLNTHNTMNPLNVNLKDMTTQ